MTRFVLGLCLFGLWGQLSAAEPNTSDDSPTLRTNVVRWVADLGAPGASQRAAAAKALELAGPQILPWLPAADDVSDPATKDSLQRLRTQLERELALQSVAASRVTYAGPLVWDEVRAVIKQQTGNRLLPIELPKRTSPDAGSAVSWNAVPFWQAVGEIEHDTRKRLLWNSDFETYGMTPSDQRESIQATGAVRLLLEPARLHLPSAESQLTLLRCEARLQVEPRLRPLFARVKMSDWSGSAEGHSLTPWNPAADYELAFPDRASEIRQTLTFVWPEISAVTPWSLQGKVTVHVAAGREEFSFGGADLVRGRSIRRGGVVVRLREVRFQPVNADHQQARVRIVVNYDRGGPAFESHRVGLFHRSAWLTDRSGQIIPATDFDIAAEVDGGLVIEYRFAELSQKPADYRFTYEAPTLLLDVPAEFSFTNLPLPTIR